MESEWKTLLDLGKNVSHFFSNFKDQFTFCYIILMPTFIGKMFIFLWPVNVYHFVTLSHHSKHEGKIIVLYDADIYWQIIIPLYYIVGTKISLHLFEYILQAIKSHKLNQNIILETKELLTTILCLF